MPKKLSNALTPLTIKNAKAGRHVDGGGLQLLVKKSGARSWVYRYTIKGRSRDIGLGPAAHDGRGGISLAHARDEAAALRLKVRAGIDPLAERQIEASLAAAAAQAANVAQITFKDVAMAYIAMNEDSWRNAKHRQQWKNTLQTYAYPVIGDMPVAEVETRHVLQIIEPIWKEVPETASRVRGRIEKILDSAKARGLRTGANPALWRGHVDLILPKPIQLSRGHHRALPFKDMPAFFRKLRVVQSVGAQALEWTILNAARSGETIGARWSEIDIAEAVWIVPKERMKTGKEHVVPLTPRAVEIIEGLRALGSDYLFPNRKGDKLSGMAMAMMLRRMDIDATVHGFRSSFRDWAAESTSYANEVAEMALAHSIQSKTERSYRRGDLLEKRRLLMNDWAEFCAGDDIT